MQSMNLYLDTCVISGHAKGDLSADEVRAVTELLSLYSTGKVSLVTSTVTKEEIDRIPEKYRAVHEETYELLKSIQAIGYLVLDLGFGIHLLGVKRHSTYDDLRALLKDDDDAKHLYQAYRHGASHFLTVDSRTILSKASEIEKLCGVKPILPSAFIGGRNNSSNAA